MITVYATLYHRDSGSDQDVRRLEMPQVPAAGETIHFDDDTPAGTVNHVSWVRGDERFGEPGVWHAELSVRS